MSSLIVDKCYYTQLALQTLLQHNGLKKKEILSLTDISSLQEYCNTQMPEIIFVNEECFLLDSTEGERLRRIINAHPDTLFFIFISKENLNYQNYIPIRNNIIILSKSIRTEIVDRLLEHNLKQKRLQGEQEPLDLTPVSLSRTESDILKMWMSGLDTVVISRQLNIKEKTVSSHKGNIKRKVKIHNKQAIYHIVKLTDTLTSGVYINRSRAYLEAANSLERANLAG